MNSNNTFNYDSKEKQVNSQELPSLHNKVWVSNQQYFPQLPPLTSSNQQQQPYQYAQNLIPINSKPLNLLPQNFDPVEVLKNQHSFGSMDTQSFVKTMEFKKEEEITKQYSYKLEMLKLSMKANIPGHMIPQLFTNDSEIFKKESSATIEPAGSYETTSYTNFLPDPNSDVVLIDPHKQIRVQPDDTASITGYFDDSIKDINHSANQNLMPPNFKRHHKRTNSPSRIGEAGVKALDKIVSVNESQENSKNNSRISSLNANNNIEKNNSLFKPSLKSFQNNYQSSLVSTGTTTKVASITNNARTSDSKNKEQTKTNIVSPVIGSFIPQHRRFNSLPTVLKPSPFLTSSKSNNFAKQTNLDNQTSEALLELSQQKKSSFGINSGHNRKRSYNFISQNRDQIDLSRASCDEKLNVEYVINKKFKFGNAKSPENLFLNASPDTDVDNLSNPQSRTVSDNSVSGNTIKNNSKTFSEPSEEYDYSKSNESVADHDTTIEEESNENNSDLENSIKKVQFVDKTNNSKKRPKFEHRRTNTLESILN